MHDRPALERVRTETAETVQASSFVRVEDHAASRFAEERRRDGQRVPDWDHELQFSDGTERTAEWIFVLDALNFSFWPDPGNPRWTVEWGGGRKRGYFALSSALKRALLEGVPVTDAGFLARVTENELAEILRGDGPVPLLAERASILRENARILIEKYGGRFSRLLEDAGGSAAELVELVATEFPSFRDVQTHQGRPVHFLKRAQILVSDLWGAFGGKGLGAFSDMASLTAFADYRIPQILRSLGVIVYADELADKVDCELPLPSGSPEEVEIRAATVQGVEAIVEALSDLGVQAHAFGVDWLLWHESHRPEHNRKPYHLTRTIFY